MKKTMILLLALLLVALPMAYAQDDGEVTVFTLTTTEDGAFALSYLPDGWTFQQAGNALLISNNPALFEEDTDVATGEVLVAVVPLAVDDLVEAGDTREAQFEALLIELTADPDDPNDPVVVSDIQELPDYGEEALYAYGANSKAEADVVYYPLAPGYWAVGYISTSIGELEGELGTMGWDVLGGVFFSAPLDAPFAGAAFSFNLPADWPVNEDNAPVVYIVGSSEEALVAPELGFDDYYLLVGDVAAAGVDVATLSLTDEATSLATVILSEGEVLDTAFLIELNGMQIGVVEVYNADDANVGGVVVAEIPGIENAVYGVAYGAYPGRAIEIIYTAIQVLMSISLNAQ